MVSPAVVLSSYSVASFTAIIFVTITTSSSKLLCPSPMAPTCNCSNTPEDYELQCPAFTVRVQPQAVVRIQCAINDVNDFSLLNVMNIGEVHTLIIRQCPLSSVSLDQFMQNMGVSNVNNVQITYTRVHDNFTTTVTRELFHGLSNVTSLTLHTSVITQLPDDVFNDMPNLKHIDLKTNNVVLPKAIFYGVPKLLELELGSNSLTYLQPGIFHNLTDLRSLKLWGNLCNLSKAVFNDIQNLELLDINSNKMASLPSDLFVDLINLREMNLQENEFLSLPQNLFISNAELETINLQDNRRTLKTLPSRLLANLTKLKEVKVNSCIMSTLPEDLLWGSTSIKAISLRNNTLTTLPELLFKDCTELSTLDISFNRITELPNQIFSNTTQLHFLIINDNRLNVIENGLFSHLDLLVSLDLKNNGLSHIGSEIFPEFCNLTTVDMSNNMLTFEETLSLFFDSPLRKCKLLKDIQLANNSLKYIFAEWKEMEFLEILNLSYNKISQLEVADFYFVASTFVDLSYNNISKIDIFYAGEVYRTTEPENINVPVINFFIKGNHINCDCNVYNFLQYEEDKVTAVIKLTMEIKPGNSQCVKLEAYTGQLVKNIPLKLFTCLLGREFSPTCSEQCSCLLRHSDRVLVVDCHQKNLTSMPEALPEINFSLFTELILSGNRIKSVKSPLGPGYYKVTKYILSDNMISDIDLTVFSTRQVEDMNFTPFHNASVDLSYNNISKIDIFDDKRVYTRTVQVDMNVPIINIIVKDNPIDCECSVYNLLQYEGNEVKEVFKLTMETKPDNLQCVNLQAYIQQPILNIPLKLFTCLHGKEFSPICSKQCSCLLRHSDRVLVVDCQQKNLTSMPEALPNINFSRHTELNLSGNNIKSVKLPLGPGYNKVIKYILSNNMISEIDLTELSPKLQVLELDGNSISQFSTSSLNFLLTAIYLTQLTLHKNPWKCDCTTKDLVTTIQKVDHLKKIKPLDNTTCENGKELWKMSDTELCPVESEIVVYISFTVAALGILFGLYYRFQREIKVWLYAHHCCLCCVNEQELDKDKEYDAFISYSHHDEDFVADHLVPGLEDGPTKYNICLHYRDWVAGEFIPAQIARSVERSRRTIVVLSPAFLKSIWGRLEFRAAHRKAFSERRLRVIVIMYRDIGPTDKLDSDLQAYLRVNTLKWGDPSFWDKLHYAMPHTLKFTR